MTIRIGLIGAGVMGADHARLFSEEVPGASLQVIWGAERARLSAQ
jgi:myo-inositol 2-dehydrogenase / D-chiro-inositol 1-dehydrogenase